MEHGDISNVEPPRLWFVCEGLVLLPQQEVTHYGRRAGSYRRMEARVRNAYVMNTIVLKRLWDLMFRQGMRCSIVTFVPNSLWIDVVQAWFDEVDMPAPLRSYSVERFMDEVVTLPSTARVFDPDPAHQFRYGGKGVIVNPHYDFEPMA